jgi:protein-L-isoaspartate(D-aspartate) O-methyltransferase
MPQPPPDLEATARHPFRPEWTLTDSALRREAMVEQQIASRGIGSKLVLDAIRHVPREAFLPAHLREFAYEDSALPIDANQTISQPYIVALMTEALDLRGNEKVLEIGTGSGYAAAILAEIAREVYTIERIGQLAERAASIVADLGYDNVHVKHADGTKGWIEQSPFDAIVVAAGGPGVPAALKSQLKIGGRLVIPVGSDPRIQELVRVTRLSETEFKQEDLADVRFVPLIGKEGWFAESEVPAPLQRRAKIDNDEALRRDIRAVAFVFDGPEEVSGTRLAERTGERRIVLIGEATHGTSEFYRARNAISRELIEKHGFSFVAIESDWPDAARIDDYVRHFESPRSSWAAFARFPTWMWRNVEVKEFVEWLRGHNTEIKPEHRVAFYGLDLYSLHTSIGEVVKYLEGIDPEAAQIARERYACLTPWQGDPATYGRAALSGPYRSCEKDVVQMLRDLLAQRSAYSVRDGERFLDAVQNARLVKNAERYYRTMYYGSRESWNLRDTHMFDTLESLLAFHGPASKAIIWAHNSHVGDALATEMAARGEINIGHLCREKHGEKVHIIGMGTNSGTVAAASHWGGPMEVKQVRSAVAQSYERLFHETGIANFNLDLAAHAGSESGGLADPRLERAIGVIYRPDTELASHYFQAVIARQFDDYLWFDETRAVAPLPAQRAGGLPETYPFGV